MYQSLIKIILFISVLKSFITLDIPGSKMWNKRMPIAEAIEL